MNDNYNPPSPAIKSRLRQSLAKAFSKQYRSTRWMSLIVIAQYFLFAPIEPWIPDSTELHEVSGKAVFKKYLAGSASGVHLKINGLLLNCSFSGMALGLDGCDHFEELVSKNEPVIATWFWAASRYGLRERMLNTMAQNGRPVITSAMTYERRMEGYRSDIKSTRFSNILVVFILIVFFYTDHRKMSNSANN